MTGPLVSIVVPAHNEAAVIGANLRRLLEGTAPGEFDVIVVANACGDRTAEVAAEAGVRVLETSIPGKVPALRLGDEACRTFPRIYLDADVELTADSVRALVRACERPGVLACAPVPELDLARVGRLVRRVHRVHDRLIAPMRALAGVGVYVLTEAGHARVFPMPDVIADDGWVHASFGPDERVVVAEARSLVRPARTVKAHLNRRVRVRRGNRQLAGLQRAHAEGGPGLGSLAALLRRREVSPVDAACYLSVLVLDRTLSRVRRDRAGWGSDLSTRSALSTD
ncbi:glycosyltransferase [Dactylosporangium sp. NPDC049140]|uniref:glycosyltransferase n=1 Tax=Dactylosporangium sp. NPDC049140 TaxID=3155647 RepID=UPI003408D97B